MTDATQSHQTNLLVDPLDLPVWGARGIQPYVRKPLKAVQQMLYRGQLDATKKDGQWVSTPRRLLTSINGDPTSIESPTTTREVR
jgi:hypothetical protein